MAFVVEFLMKIVILGNVCVDHNVTEKTSYKAAGGPTTFISIVFNQLIDSRVTVISSYGPDFLPYKKNLRLYPLRPNTANSLIYDNVIKNGRRKQKCYFHKTNLPIQIDKNARSLIGQADCLFITPLVANFSPEYLKKAVNFAQKKCLKILLPQGYFRKFNRKNEVVFRRFAEAGLILPLVDIVILSDKDYPNVEKISVRWAKKHKITVIITREEKGARVVGKNELVDVSVKPVSENKIVDSVGAGDVFAAGFAYLFLKTKDLIKSVNYANEIARQSLFYSSGKLKITDAFKKAPFYLAGKIVYN